MGEGWIKLYRKLLDKAIWQCSTPQQKVILITLLLMANHEEKEWEWNGRPFKCRPGQFITSLSSIAEKAGKNISIQNVRSALEKFKKYEFLTYESTKTGRLVSITNWGLYQDLKAEGNKDTNKEVTKSQQRGNKEVTTNKNDKNVKNDKKYIYSQNSNEFRLSKYLLNYIKLNNPNAKEPDLQNWSKQFDYILRIDKRDIEEVKKVIVWSQKDSFWMQNILSPQKLRDKYDQLVLQMKNKSMIHNRNSTSGYIDSCNKRGYDMKALEKKLLKWENKY